MGLDKVVGSAVASARSAPEAYARRRAPGAGQSSSDHESLVAYVRATPRVRAADAWDIVLSVWQCGAAPAIAHLIASTRAWSSQYAIAVTPKRRVYTVGGSAYGILTHTP